MVSSSRPRAALSGRIAAFLRKEAHTVTESVKSAHVENSIEESVKAWTARQFQEQNAIIFIGAAGIAVRSVAPMTVSKCKDPAVLVIDEKGKFCIPILSGHIGGANALASKISDACSMQAVITTATDVQEKWAVDVFAVENQLQIKELKKAKEISARVLAGEKIRYFVEEKAVLGEKIPKELQLIDEEEARRNPPDIYTGIHMHPEWEETLCLVPKAVVIGIGCKKGTSMEKIEMTVREVLEQEGICPDCLAEAASIDLKAEEQGLIEYCEKYHLDFHTYSSAELGEAEGDFTGSDFVKKITGVDNICERSAICASKGGRLLSKKYARDGVTAALAVKKWGVRFE